jgi:hypothetical protein
VNRPNFRKFNEQLRRHKQVSLSQTRRLVKSLLGPEGRVWFAENSYTIGTQLADGGRFVLGGGKTLPEAFHAAILEPIQRLQAGQEKPAEQP